MLRLSFAVEEAELCCQSCVSPIKLAAMWVDHRGQVKPGYREMRKGKKHRADMKDGDKP